jgi:hypothetical protein
MRIKHLGKRFQFKRLKALSVRGGQIFSLLPLNSLRNRRRRRQTSGKGI